MSMALASDSAPQRTILIADGNLVLARALAHALESFGYRAIPFQTSREVLDFLHYRYGDLLLTDVMLGGASGVALAAAAQSLRPGLRVIFMSGRDRAYLECKGVDLGVTPLLVKLFSLPVLRAAIERELQDRTDGARFGTSV